MNEWPGPLSLFSSAQQIHNRCHNDLPLPCFIYAHYFYYSNTPVSSSTSSAIFLLWFSNLFLILYKQFPSFVSSVTWTYFIDFLYAPCSLIINYLKCTLVQALRLCSGHAAHRWSRGIAPPFLTTAVEGGEGSVSRPGRSLPPGKTQYPLYRRLGGPQGWSGQVRKIWPLPGFDPQTVQPVASRYTVWTILAQLTTFQKFWSPSLCFHTFWNYANDNLIPVQRHCYLPRPSSTP
jgi:hypothetical protein